MRIATGQQLSNAEIITTLRYFQQTLIGFLKEIPAENSALFEQFNGDAQRSTFYPNLNYSGLFYGIVNLLDAFSLLTSGQTDIGQAILDTLKALYFFLDKDCIDQLPYLVASQLGVFPSELNKKIVYLLADCIVPYSLGEHASGGLSVSGVLMLVLQHSNDSTLHTLIVESLMSRRENVYHDLLAVIAKGTSESRIPAANLLFHYWPLINPAIIHRKHIQYRVQAWSSHPCQNLLCNEKNHSTRRSYDPVVCAKYGDTAPPMSLCNKCCSDIETAQPLRFICQPMAASTSTICQNKACESSNRIAVATCFAEDCIRSHGYVPLRLCQECFAALHNNPIAESHIRHKGMVCAWGTNVERNMIEAVVKLLKETSCQLEGNEGEAKRPKWLRQLEGGQVLGKDIDAMADERRMLSRFGVWMMAALCPLLWMLLHGLHNVDGVPVVCHHCSLPNDSMGSTIEQLKTDWVNLAISNHYEILVSILLPDLPEYAQVGGIWDKWCSRKEQMKEVRCNLIPNVEQGDSHWLQAISQEVEEEDLLDLKVLLCKIFEPDLCPLPFEQNKVFEFVSVRLNSGVYEDIIQALDWLHLLSRINIRISLHMLLDMFVESLQKMRQFKIASKNEENDLDEDGPLAIEVIMVDVIAQQVKLNEIDPYETNSVTDQMFSTSALLLQYLDESEGTVQQRHSCQNPETDQFSDCQRCQQSAFLYQVGVDFCEKSSKPLHLEVLMHLTEQICPKEEIKIECDMSNMSDWLAETQMTDSVSTVSHLSNLTSPRNPSFQGALSPFAKEYENMAKEDSEKTFRFLSCTSPKTAMLEEETSRDEFVGVLPSEEIETATAQATTLTERDVGHETCQILQTTLVDSLKKHPTQPQQPKRSRTEFWDTSVGRFRFQFQQLPASLRFIHSLVMNIDREVDPDVQYFILNILKYLCLHCEALKNARREHRGFLIWIQENFLIPRLWTLLRSDFTQVGQLAVPLLIHAITLPCGEEFSGILSTLNSPMKSGKSALKLVVERVYVLAHMIVVAPVKANRLLQTCLSCAFSHLVVSAHDPNAAVAQRAILALKAMPSSSLNLMCVCFESQFDSCILDRPLIIGRINLLTTLVPEENILTWDFFIQRFETLALEAQLKNHVGDSTFVQDLLHTDPMSELYQRKVTKARQSLNEADSVRSIVKSLRDNSLKHQLTMSAKVDKGG
uniref:Uncoordinated protein 79 n=1 Tax=Ditylenchus dipsaci TaxID=166011 RepID=A0A915E3W4_9BILA